MTEVDWPSLVAALSRVERFSAGTSGLLCFGANPQGGIFIEGGRVCWVAAQGFQRRLRDLLGSSSGVDAAELERIYERCRAGGKLLGQTLVDDGLLQPQELERALRRHSAECLVDLCRHPCTTHWASHAGRGYAPRFTFRPVDLLFDSVALHYSELQTRARSELAHFVEPGQHATAFVVDHTLDALLPLAATEGSEVCAMAALGRSVESIPRASRELGTTPSFTLSATSTGEAVVLWWREAVLFAVACADRTSLAAATARRLAQS